jgi:hypothetical protein
VVVQVHLLQLQETRVVGEGVIENSLTVFEAKFGEIPQLLEDLEKKLNEPASTTGD